MIKLLATDLDGTLFYPKRRFSLMTKANQKFMADFYHAGGENVLVTGRGKRVSGKVQKKLGIPISVLGCNGAFVYEDGKYVTSHPMDKNALMDLYMKLRTNFGIIAWLVLDDTDEIKIAATNVGNWLKLGAFTMNFFNFTYSEKFIASEPRLIESIAKGTVYKIMPIFGITPAASDKASRAYVALQEKYKDKFYYC
jgi:hydroxymethylpyrimidine pyrophosphatase-like HAD family hydrolase